MRCWAGSQEGLVLLQHRQGPSRQGEGALPTTPCSPPTLCFIHLGHAAFWESRVCEPKGSTEHEAATLSFWAFRHQWNINKNILTQTAALPSSPSLLMHGKHNPKPQQHPPDPKIPPSCPDPPGAGSGKRALQLHQEGQRLLTLVQIKDHIHLTAAVS